VATGASDAFGPPHRAEPTAADYVAETFAEKLERLFRTVRPQGRDEFTPDEVSSAIAKRGGPTISSTYIYMLRRGQRDNPTKKHLEALADFFGVPPAYFFDDDTAARVNAELDLLVSLRDASVRDIALRATGLSSRSLATIREVVERVRQLEGLEDSPSGQSPQSEP
jgi:transcriptional regulator with XRE-family HTH domain